MKPPEQELVHKVFAEQPAQAALLSDGESRLTAFLTGNCDYSEYAAFLRQPETAFLTNPHPLLRGLSPMAALRKSFEANYYKSGVTVSKQTTTPEARKSPAEAERDYHQGRESFPSFAVLADHGDLTTLWDGTTTVHLSAQHLVNLRNLQEVVQRCPSLQVLQVSRARLKLVSQKMKDLLESQGVELRVGRVRDYPYYDQQRENAEYYRRKDLYETARRDPQRNAILEKLRVFEFEEVEVLELYLGSTRRSVREVADILGQKEALVRTELSAMLYWLGVPLTGKGIKSRSRFLLAKLDRLEKAQQDEQRRVQLRIDYSAAGVAPPELLPLERWDIWQKLTGLIQKDPKALNAVEEWDQRAYQVLVDYYQLTGGRTIFLGDISNKIGVSRERVRQLKNEALGRLGIEAES